MDYYDEIASPNGDLEMIFSLTGGTPTYSLAYKGKPLVLPSRLGVVFEEADLSEGLTLEYVENSDVDEDWTQPWGEEKEIRNHYTEVKFYLSRDFSRQRMNLVFRLYDDGIGFRYEWPEQEGLQGFVITDEITEFNLPADHTSWWIGAYQLNRYEHLFNETRVSEIDTVHTPFTMKTDEGLHLSIHEAALTDFASMTIANKGNDSLEVDLVPWLNGDKVRGSAPHQSPWRTIALGETAGDLMTNYLMLNLNEPSKLDGADWIKPGKYTGIWWDMHLGTKTWESGPKHGATTEYAKEMLDFTAKHGFQGTLVEGWNKGWDGSWFENGDVFSFTEAYPDFDLEEVAAYADSLGVQLIGHHETSAGIANYEAQVDAAFALYNRLGVHTVKTGYVGDFVDGGEWHHGQFMVRHYRDIVKKAAESKIMLDVHEPIKDTGIRRTWPNMMTREGARGQEYNAWSEDGGNPPSYTTIVPFTRGLVSPFDYTPGVFNLLLTDKPENPNNNRLIHTLAKELALYVVIYSPLQMVADLPKNLEAHPDALDWVKVVPVDWEKTLVPEAEIGEYVVVVRKDRNSGDWYLGGITDEEARDFTINLDFLEEGKTYQAEIWADGEDADWDTNPYPLKKSLQDVTADSVLKLNLAKGGGVAVRFAEEE
ncbi:glycoside hydrolase family 97 protein [Gracilimonas mengyeensis]|uniref:Alpha-glucosidase n=1 Tax=Gracilimonas mengyeensis TaxID=1302730 RepID=A0A521EK87_9BACT|nr:glycoside hydrolase family 97 protein [Gracilimonas mengyeensis]SMO84324.1 alpha-glucosidase [Gracilimonas mengyeensis]